MPEKAISVHAKDRESTSSYVMPKRKEQSFIHLWNRLCGHIQNDQRTEPVDHQHNFKADLEEFTQLRRNFLDFQLVYIPRPSLS